MQPGSFSSPEAAKPLPVVDMQNTRPVLEVVGVSKSFASITVLHSIDLALYRGEVHALLGENGAGKSTLVRILSGIIGEFGGSMLLDGVETRFIPDLYEANLWAHLRRPMDMIFQG